MQYIANKTHVRACNATATRTPTLMTLMCNCFLELNFESHIGHSTSRLQGGTLPERDDQSTRIIGIHVDAGILVMPSTTGR